MKHDNKFLFKRLVLLASILSLQGCFSIGQDYYFIQDNTDKATLSGNHNEYCAREEKMAGGSNSLSYLAGIPSSAYIDCMKKFGFSFKYDYLKVGLKYKKNKEYSKAIEALKYPATNENNPYAQMLIGEIYLEDSDIYDVQKALYWLSLSANQKYKDSYFSLGYLYASGKKDFPVNIEEAINWFEKSAKAGDGQAGFNLWVLYRRPSKLTNINSALGWLNASAESGYQPSHFELGKIYYTGQFVSADLIKSYVWLDMASMNGDIESIKLKGEVTQKLTVEQLNIAKDNANSCKLSKFKRCN